VVVGVGNVSMDVTRVLVQDREVLGRTDIAAHALEALRDTAVTDVYVLGRRGAAQAAFSPGEIKEIEEIEGVDLVVRPEDVELDPASAAWVEQANDKQVNANLAFLREVAGRPLTKPRRVHLMLNTSPIAIHGEDGRVTAVEVGRNRIEERGGRLAAVDTGERTRLDAGLVFRAIGYRGIPIPGVPFDERSGTIPNVGGRVTRDGQVVERLYVAGWAKRGPTGLIGTNRADARDTVDRMLEDRSTLPAVEREPIAYQNATSWADWQRLDAEERRRGEEAGKLREKFTSVSDMLAVLERE
ncbi:MAG: NADP oxidoreductase, partial [Myxococcales bacterium]|nr:NADP oxidoreductase [Myxococcales bacterium]